MSKEELQALQDALNLKQRELDLLTAIDDVRDTRAEPTGMMIALVDLLTDRLPADLCMMFLVDRETSDVELKAVSVRRQELVSLQQVISRQLAEQAVALDDVTIWQAGDVLPSQALTSLAPGLQLAAVPIIM